MADPHLEDTVAEMGGTRPCGEYEHRAWARGYENHRDEQHHARSRSAHDGRQVLHDPTLPQSR